MSKRIKMLQGHRLEEVIAYEQGLLDDDETLELELHMRGCAECRRTLSHVTESMPEMRPGFGGSGSADVYEMMERSLGRG